MIKSSLLFFFVIAVFRCSEPRHEGGLSKVSNYNDSTNIDINDNARDKDYEVSDLTFLNKNYDFGKVPQDTLLIAKYYFINTGNNDLFISSVQPDCTCTGHSIGPNPIASKDTSYIELKVNTSNKFGKLKLYSVVNANTAPVLYKLTLKADIYDRDH